MQKMTPQKYLPVFARVRIQAPHVFAEKLIPQEIFPACIGFVPGGKCKCNFGEINLKTIEECKCNLQSASVTPKASDYTLEINSQNN